MIVDNASSLGVSSKDVARFYKDQWPKPVILSDDVYYQWQFCASPKNGGLDKCVLAFDEKADQIAGVMGLHERDFYLGGQCLEGAELTTWVVSEDYRGSGAGGKIIQHLKNSYEVLTGMGISDAALPVYLRSGFRFLSMIPRFVKVLNPQKVEQHADYNTLGLKLARGWARVNSIPYAVRECNEDLIDLAFKSATSYLNLFSRLAPDLDWRFKAHPVFDFEMKWVAASQNVSQGVVVVYRIVEVGDELKVLHLIDLFGDLDSVNCGRAFIEELAQDKGVDVIDFYCTASPVSAYFLAHEWFAVPDDKWMKFPHLFSPIELREPQTTSLIYWCRDHMAELANLGSLYVSKSDNDLDRPVYTG